MTDERPPPLSGIRVLDLGRIYLGPWAGFLLAMAGADVVKVEEPGGEPVRGRGRTGTSVPFALLNASKRSLVLDLKRPAARQVLIELATQADVVLENFAPGVMEGLGVGPDVLLAANPRLVYAAATGYGTSGPDRDRLAMDITVQAHTGVMSVTGFPDQPPVKAGPAFVDFLAGTHLYAGIVTALFERERTGRGRVVDVAMVDTVVPTLASNLASWHALGRSPRTGNRHGGQSLAPYNVYPAADGYVALIVITEDQWGRLARVMGRPELAADHPFATNAGRVRAIDEVDALVGTWTAAMARDEVVARCREARVPAAPVRDVGEVLADAHMHERGALHTIEHPDLGPLVVPHSPLRFRGSQPLPLRPSPALGAHGRQVLAEWLGLSGDRLEARTADVAAGEGFAHDDRGRKRAMDAITMLKADHKKVEGLFKRFEKAGPKGDATRKQVVDQVIEELSMHAAIEEQVFYPSARREVPVTEDEVLEALEEHHIVKWVLSELEGMSPDDERFTPKMTVLMESVRHHVKEEEGELFPEVRKALGRKALQEIGEAMEAAKQLAPTRPHPRSPDTPPGNMVVGAAAGMADKALKVVKKASKAAKR